MFAPVPTNTGPSIAAEIHFDDGRIERWEPFDAPDWQMLRDRRWEKVAKSLQGTDRHELWPLFAEALRRRWSIEGQVTDVVLLRTSYEPLKANRQNAEVQLERIEQPFFSMASGILFVNGGAESSMELD